MRELLEEKKEKGKKFLEEYGKVVFVLVGIIVLIICLYFIFVTENSGELKVIFFDIGQGDSIFIETPSHKKMIIDGGPTNKVLTKLDNQMGLVDKDIDVIVATHADADHVTGLIPVLEKYNVKNIVESPVRGTTKTFALLDRDVNKEKENGAKVYIAKTGDAIDFHDGVIATVLYPTANYIDDGKTNEASVSILLTYLDKSFLLTGDLPTTRENKLIYSGLLPKSVTVYKAGHHGSKYSSGVQLLSYISPYYSVISAGKDNRYGHPNGETIERLKKYGKVILSTIDKGDVEFDVGEGKFGVR